jgi:hypothetical protein
LKIPILQYIRKIKNILRVESKIKSSKATTHASIKTKDGICLIFYGVGSIFNIPGINHFPKPLYRMGAEDSDALKESWTEVGGLISKSFPKYSLHSPNVIEDTFEIHGRSTEDKQPRSSKLRKQ